jgi:hypothetical protein
MEHKGHLVQWHSKGKKYQLYCFTCGKLLAHETETPNRREAQRFEQAIENPTAITITLDVQPVKHKQRATTL